MEKRVRNEKNMKLIKGKYVPLSKFGGKKAKNYLQPPNQNVTNGDKELSQSKIPPKPGGSSNQIKTL